MNSIKSCCDDYYVNLHLSTEMDLPRDRSTVLHFFERLQKSYPALVNFASRDQGGFIIEEDKDQSSYRWVSIDTRRLSSGMVNAEQVEDAVAQHNLVLELAPYLLSLSPIDCDAMDLLFGFDFTFRGNHNELVAEALGLGAAMEKLGSTAGASIVEFEPNMTIALDSQCRMQCRLNVETRTNIEQIRTGEYAEDQLSVYLTARHYGSLQSGESFSQRLSELSNVCSELIDSFVLPNVLEPLARTISFKGN